MTAPLPNARSTEETPRRRKPFNFSQDVGKGFIWGSVLGSAYHFPKGGLHAVWTKVPPLSGNLAVLCGAYGAIEHAMVSARGKEEPVLNHAVAGAGACGIASIHKGVRTAAGNTLVGGALFGAVQAGLLMLDENRRRKLSRQQADVCPTCLRGRVPDDFPGTPPVAA